MTKRATVLINSVRRKSRVHSVMSLRQIMCGKKFETPLYEMGELMMASNIEANNKTSRPRAFYVLYIGPNDGGTSNSVLKLSTKKMIITPRYKPVPMSDNMINLLKNGRRRRNVKRDPFLQYT